MGGGVASGQTSKSEHGASLVITVTFVPKRRLHHVPAGLRSLPEGRSRGKGAGENGRSGAAAGGAEMGGDGAEAERAPGGL